MKGVVIIVAFLVICASYGQAGPLSGGNGLMWKPCPDVQPTGKILSMKVDGRDDVCSFIRGTTVNITISFTVSKALKDLKAIVHGEVFGTSVPFPLPSPDCCDKHGLTCPLTPGKTYTYTGSVPVLKIYPAIGVMVKWENQGSDGKDAICAVLNCHLT